MARQIVGVLAGLGSIACSFGVIYSVWAANDVPGNDAWGQTFWCFLFGAIYLHNLFERNADRKEQVLVEGPTGPAGPPGPPGPQGRTGPAAMAIVPSMPAARSGDADA